MEGWAIRDQFRYCETILALGAGVDLLEVAGVSTKLPSGEAELGATVFADAQAGADWLIAGAIARHRHPEHETDPPTV